MALKSNFYEEIFTNEKKWIEMINKNLLNNIYCSLGLKPFYMKKREEILSEYEITNNPILGQILDVIDSIIKKIDEFEFNYKNLRYVDISSLLPLFLTNRMNNTTSKNDTRERVKILKEQKKSLEAEIRNYTVVHKELDDYVYDDFPDDYKKAI